MGQKLNSNFHNFLTKGSNIQLLHRGKESNEEKLIFLNFCF